MWQLCTLTHAKGKSGEMSQLQYMLLKEKKLKKK